MKLCKYIIIIASILISNVIYSQFQLIDGPFGCSILSLEIKDSIFYAGAERKGLFKSNDHGDSWTEVNIGLNENASIEEVFAKDSMIFLCTNGLGLFQSSDYGKSWTKNTNGLSDNFFAFKIISADSVIIIQASRGLYYSYDQGFTWIEKNGNLPMDTLQMVIDDPWVLETVISPIHLFDLTYYNNTLYAGTELYGLLISKDLGLTWSWLDSVCQIQSVVTNIIVDEDLILVATYQGLLIRRNIYENWTVVNLPSDISITKLYKYDNTYYCLTLNKGVWTSIDGIAWMESNEGLEFKKVNTMAFTDSLIFVGTEIGGPYKTRSGIIHWYPANYGCSRQFILTLAGMNHRLYAGSESGYVYGYNNTNESWSVTNTDQSLGLVNQISNINNNLWAATNKGIFKKIGETNWQKFSSGLPSVTYCRSITGNCLILTDNIQLKP